MIYYQSGSQTNREHGRMYFKNHDTEGTAWDDPRASEEEMPLQHVSTRRA